ALRRLQARERGDRQGLLARRGHRQRRPSPVLRVRAWAGPGPDRRPDARDRGRRPRRALPDRLRRQHAAPLRAGRRPRVRPGRALVAVRRRHLQPRRARNRHRRLRRRRRARASKRGDRVRGRTAPVPGRAPAALVRLAADAARAGHPRDCRAAPRRRIVEPQRPKGGERMAEIRGCDLVVEYLIKEKVPYMFGYAGHGAVGLLDGVYNHQDEIKIIFPWIECAAGYMADAYFRASGQVIPVYTSTGPGPMLLTVAMGNAFYDSSAFVAITGQVATNQYDSGALQEEYRHYQADFPSMAKVITKRSFQAQSVEDLGKFLPKAFKLARTGRPGPVHIDVPYDLWIRSGDVEVPEPEERSLSLNWRTPGSPGAVAAALELLTKAKRPLILAGGGVISSDASAEVQAFAE